MSDALFGGRVKTDLIYESVVRANAAERRGTHATKNRGLVSGSGKKPWRQKGTGRARVGEIRNPLWRKGGTVFGPQPRSYDYQLPQEGRAGRARARRWPPKIQGGAVIVVDALSASARSRPRRRSALLKRLGVTGKALLVDVQPDEKLALSVRNLAGVVLLPSNRITARDVADTTKVVVTQAALEKLEAALG